VDINFKTKHAQYYFSTFFDYMIITFTAWSIEYWLHNFNNLYMDTYEKGGMRQRTYFYGPFMFGVSDKYPDKHWRKG
jgi:hypothetical protein